MQETGSGVDNRIYSISAEEHLAKYCPEHKHQIHFEASVCMATSWIVAVSIIKLGYFY